MSFTPQISFSGFDIIAQKQSTYLRRKVRAVLEILDLKDQLLTIHLCDDAEIKALNRRFRRKNKATDVLSFEAMGEEGDPFFEKVLGDIVISVETARRQAEEGGHTLQEELIVLCVHGLLHLLGFDHEDGDEEAVRQAEAELFLLSEIDVPVEIALIGRQLIC